MSASRLFYPRSTLRWGAGFSVALVVLALVGWFALDAEIRAQFTGFQIATLLLFIAVMIGMMLGVGTCTVRADEQGLRVRNAFRTHVLPWGEISEIRFRQGDPWPFAYRDDDPDDPSRVMLLGIQSTDGERAREAVAELERLWVTHRG